jgi:hypothetical protein
MVKGGRYVSSGSYACTFSPPVACDEKKKGKTDSKEYVGKVFERRDDGHDEQRIQKVIDHIDPKHTFTIPLVSTCSVSKFSKQDQAGRCELPYDEKGERFQIVYRHGGKDLFYVSVGYGKKGPVSSRNMFIKVFKMLRPLLVGLKGMNAKGWYHLDIKPANILYNGNKLHLIDFGLARQNTAIYSTEPAYLDMLAYDYPYYPPEFKMYCYLQEMDKLPSLESFKRSVAKNFRYVHVRDKGVLGSELKGFLKKVQTKDFASLKSPLATKADVYGLGVTILELHDYLVENDNEFTKSIFQWSNLLANANPYDRADWTTAIRHYDRILKTFGTA